MIKRFPRLTSVHWVATAPFLFFIIPLIDGRTIFWGLPALQFIPWRHYAWMLLREGVFPLWNPLNGMGAPLMANYQLALFYPPSFPLFLLDELWGVGGLAWGFTLLVPLHLAWGAVGMTHFLKTLGVGHRGQIIAGLAFGMSGYLVARGSFFSIIWAAAWLPWVMCWIEKFVAEANRREKLKAGLILSLFIAMMLLAGHAQISWYSLLLSGLWFLFRAIRARGYKAVFKETGLLAAFGIWAVLLAAIQLLPTFEYLQQSQRASAYDIETAMVYSFSPLRLLGYLTPELFGNPGHGDFWGYATYWEDAVYIGLAPFILALTTIFWLFPKRDRKIPNRGITAFLWAAVVTGVVFALGANTPIFIWLYDHVPTFDMFQAPARWMLWPTFSLAVLAGLAADRWELPKKKGRVILNLVAFGGVILALSALTGSLVLTGREPGIFRGLVYFGLVATVTAFVVRRIPSETQRGVWVYLTGVVITLDLLAASAFLNPTAPASIWTAENKQAATINQTRDGGRVWVDAATEQTVKYKWFFKFDDYTNRSDWIGLRSSQQANMNLLDGIPYINNFDPLLTSRYANWMEAMTDETPEVQREWLSRVGVGAEIIQDPAGVQQIKVIPVIAEPRIEWFPCAAQTASPDDAFNLAGSQVRLGRDSECLVIETETPLPTPGNGSGQGEVEWIENEPNHIVLIVNSDEPGWVLIRDSWFPGWQGEIDGNPVDLYPAEYLFKAVIVPAGSHQIELEYKPVSFTVGLILSLLSWILWCSACIYLFSHWGLKKKDQ